MGVRTGKKKSSMTTQTANTDERNPLKNCNISEVSILQKDACS
jgi:hypothetical protein